MGTRRTRKYWLRGDRRHRRPWKEGHEPEGPSTFLQTLSAVAGGVAGLTKSLVTGYRTLVAEASPIPLINSDSTRYRSFGATAVGSAGIVTVLNPQTHPNEPQGYTTYVDHDYATDPPLGFIYGGGSLKSDAGDELVSPPSYVEAVKQVDLTGGSGSPMLHYYEFADLRELKEMYVQWIYRFPANAYDGWENHPVGTKICYFNHGLADQTSTSAIYLKGTGELDMEVARATDDWPCQINIAYWENDTKLRQPVSWHGTWPTGLTVGPWHRIECLFKLNTLGVEDGEWTLWIDGVQKTHVTGRLYRTPSNPLGFYNIRFAWIWGGSGSTKTVTDYIHLGDVYVSGIPL